MSPNPDNPPEPSPSMKINIDGENDDLSDDPFYGDAAIANRATGHGSAMTNSTEPGGSVDDILENFGRSVSPVATLKNTPNPYVKPEATAKAKSQLKQLLLAELPERLAHGTLHSSEYPPEKGYGHYCFCDKDPVNKTIDQVTTTIEKLFGDNNA